MARNAGQDPIDAVTDLRARHDDGKRRAGIDATGAVVDDVVSTGDALDAQLVRTSSLARSVEFANSLLTVDSVIFDTSPRSIPKHFQDRRDVWNGTEEKRGDHACERYWQNAQNASFSSISYSRPTTGNIRNPTTIQAIALRVRTACICGVS